MKYLKYGLFFLIITVVQSATLKWEETIAKAPWKERGSHGSIAYKGKIWILKGATNFSKRSSDVLNDIWNSKDGVNWTKVTDSAAFNTHTYFSVVTFKEKMMVICGHEGC